MGDEQAASSTPAASAVCLKRKSMKGTVDLLSQFSGHTFHGRQIFDARACDTAHATKELPFFGQDIFLSSQAVDLTDPATIAAYRAALANDHRRGGRDGIDAVMNQFNLDALVAPTNSVPWKIDLLDGDHFLGGSSTPTSLAGYPAINVPAGFSFGLPIGITFMGRAFSEPTLIRVASGFEAATRARKPPRFLRTVPAV